MAQDFFCIELSLGKYLDKPLVVKDLIWEHGFWGQYNEKSGWTVLYKKRRHLVFTLGGNRKEKEEARKKSEAIKRVRS